MASNNDNPYIGIILLLFLVLFFIIWTIVQIVKGDWLMLFFVFILVPIWYLIYKWLKDSNIL